MGSRVLFVLVVIVAALVLLASSTFVVREQDQALRVRFKSVIGKDYEPGLHFKLPFIENVFKFDRRVITPSADSPDVSEKNERRENGIDDLRKTYRNGALFRARKFSYRI